MKLINNRNNFDNNELNCVTTEDCVSTISLIENSKECLVTKNEEKKIEEVCETQDLKPVKKSKKHGKKGQGIRKKIIQEIHEIIQKDIEELRSGIMGDEKHKTLSNNSFNISEMKNTDTKSITTTSANESNNSKALNNNYWSNDQYLTEKYCANECSSEILSKHEKELNNDCKQLMPDVYRKPAFTDLYEKLLMQLEMNDSYVCFQKLMIPPKKIKSHRHMGHRSSKESRVSLVGDMKKKFNNSLWFSNRYLMKDTNSVGGRKIKRKVSADMKKMKACCKESNRSISDGKWLRKSNSSQKSSVVSLTNRCSSSGISSKKHIKSYRSSLGTIQRKHETCRMGKYLFTLLLTAAK